MSSKLNGLIIIFLALALFFLSPLDSFIGIPQTTLESLKNIGIQTSFTLYSLFSVCSSQGVSIIFPQCGLVMFGSIIIFIAIFFGVILVVKGMIKKDETIKVERVKPKIAKSEKPFIIKTSRLGLTIGMLIGLFFAPYVIQNLGGGGILFPIITLLMNVLLFGAIGFAIGKLIEKK